eukprot:c24740_g1_i1 orf=294-1004(+)
MSQRRMTITVGRGGQRKATLTSSQIYSDRLGGPPSNRKRSVLERLGGSSSNVVSTGWQMDSKRQRQDSGWKQNSFEDDDDDDDWMPRSTYKNDLRYKLNQKNLHRSGQPANGSFSTVRDLCEKLSGPVPPPKRVAAVEVRKQPSASMKGLPGATLISASNPLATRINPIQKTPVRIEELTITSLLQSLGLSKYLITFQAEEVDMTALRHMGDDDLKELGVPMGPRKKILMALASHK